MKCAYHSEAEATETCANCGMPICSACGVPIDSKTYCDACIDEIFARHTAKTGGILGVLAGIVALFFGMLLTIFAFKRGDSLEWVWGAHTVLRTDWVQAGCGMALISLALMAIIGSRYALVREHYKLAVAGGVCAALAMPLLGIPALIFIVFSHDEFNQPYADSCQKESTYLLNRLHW